MELRSVNIAAEVHTFGNLFLPAGTAERPLVTFALFAYNQEQYIRDAIEGAFSQTYGPLEIVLSDDCSVDKTFQVMMNMADSYVGPHKVILRKNASNLNIGGHVRSVSMIASGAIIIMAAGDDISLPERSAKIIELFTSTPNARAVYTDMEIIDDHGNHLGHRAYGSLANGRPRLFHMVRGSGGVACGATFAYHKDCFNWPWLYPHFYNAEDRLLPLRAAILGGTLYLNETLIKYRGTSNGTFRDPKPNDNAPPYSKSCSREVVKTLKAGIKAKYINPFYGFLYVFHGSINPALSILFYRASTNRLPIISLLAKIVYAMLYYDYLFFRIKKSSLFIGSHHE
jgi:glycosyltransferase involved in cell wall biosynthesis